MTKAGNPTELHVFSFDGVLYSSPPPAGAPTSWWLSAHSLVGRGQPGFDTKWLLDGVVDARRAILTPHAKTALLTERPQHAEMEKVIRDMLRSADLPFGHIQLRPVMARISVPAYKALVVQSWLSLDRSVQRVFLYDPNPDNVQAVREVVVRAGKTFVAPRVSASPPASG